MRIPLVLRPFFHRSARIAVVLVGFLFSTLPSHSASDAVAGLSSVILTPSEIRSLQQKANQADKDAIMRLGAYYTLVGNDWETASHWYSKLAATGDSDGIYSHGISCMHLNDFDCARKSFELAKTKGHPYAESSLRELERKIADARKTPKAAERKK